MAESVAQRRVVTVSALIGFAVALTSAHRPTMLWPVWAALAASVCGVAGVVGVYGAVTWQALSRARPLPWARPGCRH